MSERRSGLGAAARWGRGGLGVAGRCLAAAILLAVLAACQHGAATYDRSTGTWGVPLGPGSNRGGQS